MPLLLGAGALVLLLVAVVGVLFVVNRSGHNTSTQGKKAKPVDAATAQLRTATADFARQPAVRYTGKITTAADDELTVDINVTQQGTTTGTFTDKGTKVALLVVDDKTFFKAPKTYWAAQATETRRAALYATQWVRVSPQQLGIDPATLLAPDVLAGKFPTSTTGPTATQIATVRGAETREISNGDKVVNVTTAAPNRVLHIRSTTDKFDLDTTFFQDAAVTTMFHRVDLEVQQLSLAIDSQVVHSVAGKVVLSPCGQSSCTATATINTLSTPYTTNTKATSADVRINFTLDSRPIGSCVKVLSLPHNGTAPAACKVTYRLPADGRTHSIEATVVPTARAVLVTDIAALRAGVSTESVSWRLRQAGQTGLPGSSDQHGPYRFVPPAGYDANTGPLQQTADGYTDADGNVWSEASAQGLAARHNFAKEWRVKLGQAGLAKWQSVAKKVKGDYILSVTPDGQLSH